MGKLIIPNNYIREIEHPLIFLAGPIKGAPNWQDEDIHFLFSQNKQLIIVLPRKGIRDRISDYIINGDKSYFER